MKSILATSADTVLERERLLDPKSTAELIGISKRQLWRLLSAGEFVQAIRIGTRIVRFRTGDVLNWIDAKKGANQHE